METPKTPEATPPKSKKTMYAVVGAIVIIIVIVAALYFAGIFTPPPPSATASAKIFDTGTCSTSTNCGFTPTPLNIASNTKVTWTSNSTSGHTVTECVSSTTSCPSPNFDASALSPALDSGVSSPIANGQSYSYTFKTAGTYYYYCQFHSWMHGKVVVS